MNYFTNYQSINSLTQHFIHDNQYDVFGMTNSLLWLTATADQPLLHFWTLADTLILGLMDQKLPHLDEAISKVTQHGYHYFLRNSGGLAVISDDGIINVSLFIPTAHDKLSVQDAYELMKQLTQTAFPELRIENFEITHSYCPGEYDLSVNGQKIAGMSQRRTESAIVVMLYISISGNQQQRGAIVREFYQTGLNHKIDKWGFPDVRPNTMTEINQLLTSPITIEDTIKRFQSAAIGTTRSLSTQAIDDQILSPEFQMRLTKETQKIIDRQPNKGGQH